MFEKLQMSKAAQAASSTHTNLNLYRVSSAKTNLSPITKQRFCEQHSNIFMVYRY